MKEFVIINLQMKGYSKTTDVRYALSENELLVEIKDSASRVHRICKTLYREVDVPQSSIELLVDFVAVKLRKQDVSVSWDQAGYDISEFSLPKRGQVKSNFITYTPPKPEPALKPKEDTEEKENRDESNKEKQPEQEGVKEGARTDPALPRHNRQLCFLNLESSSIFKIY